MPELTIKDVDGEILRLIAKIKTTPDADTSIKPIKTDSTTVEAIVSSGKILTSLGPQFGHAAIILDNLAYSMGPRGYDSHKSGKQYILSQEEFRDSMGFILRVSPDEKAAIKAELEARVMKNKEYGVLDNSCATNVAEVLGKGGIIATDPRFLPGLVMPGDVFIALGKSKRLVSKMLYKKQAE